MKRLNVGCGSVQPQGWDNADLRGAPFQIDVVAPVRLFGDGAVCALVETAAARPDREPMEMVDYDYIVCNHMLSDIGHHQLVPALTNIRSMLREGGVLRILVPDIEKAFEAYQRGDEAWFPQDEQTPGIDAKFCTFVTWYGDSESVFTMDYLRGLLYRAGFVSVTTGLYCGYTSYQIPQFEGITDLDDRCTEALIVEAQA